jgi:mannose-6-phosphate isomerase-like protein (cupin superfamily)
MTSTQDITAKFAVAAVAVAMIFSAFAPVAQAQTTEDLQQMINDLLAQVAELQSGLGGETTEGSTSAVCPYTWTRDLNVGSEGADVMKLQEFLNANADTRVAAAGSVGSAGMETMYYGPATGAAVSKFQVMHRAEVLTPAGLVNPTTYFGPSTRAKANMECVAAPMTEGEEGEEGSEEEEEETDMTLSGEGTLVTFEIDDEEDEVTEGDEDVVVMALTLEAEDGDVEVARLTFSLVADVTLLKKFLSGLMATRSLHSTLLTKTNT